MNSKNLKITEIETGATDNIETSERITALSTNFKHIIIATSKQLQVFRLEICFT